MSVSRAVIAKVNGVTEDRVKCENCANCEGAFFSPWYCVVWKDYVRADWFCSLWGARRWAMGK